ncbi:phosphatidyl inositol kinase [Steccherinum ochraceum]|uniref:1-phosphatidylinositol 4-kinase n=1 Tax=Steccherinum ochraceum TaxID=92696 RepID=A0A4R0R8R0_9APHY|nr:phosphatidyl inositol kinase [Steccherinum ochraceum]
MIAQPSRSLYIACFPMGIITLIDSALAIHQDWGFGGRPFLYTLWAFWWLDCGLSYAITFGMLYVMMVKQNHDIACMSAVWLLPVVTLVVAASAGGLLAIALKPHSELQALWTSGFSMAMVIIGLSFTFMMVTVYLLRLIIHGPPDATLSLSAFLVLGPFGQGGYCMLINGQVLSELFPRHTGLQFPQNQMAGQMIFSICFCAAYVLFSMAVAWILLACCSVGSGLRSYREPFSIGYWGLIFPNGVFALLLVQLGTVLDSSFFRAFVATWTGIVFLLWSGIFIRSIPPFIDGTLFYAPYLHDTAPEIVVNGGEPKAADEEATFQRRTSKMTTTSSLYEPHSTIQKPLAQGIDEEEEADVGEGLSPHPSSSRSGLRRAHRPGHIDLSKLDSAFKRWTESIAQKVKRKKKQEDNSRKEIWKSEFEPTIAPVAMPDYGPVKTLDHNPPMTKDDFTMLVRAVQEAIGDGIHPKMITKGSSGSYFARAKKEGKVQTVAVFKPKDEEPYGNLNPKTTKWLHRQLRWIIPFGRACLIPNLSYISEAAASLLDERLDINIVPRTELVSLASPAFYYHWLDRNAAKKGKPLPDKIGSMQYFLHGFTDASDFLRKHPWPGRAISDTFDDSSHRKGNLNKKFMTTLKIVCGRTGEEDDVYDDEDREDERVLFDVSENNQTEAPFYWSSALQDNFREELEKLVILDYLMLNTDRGADNYMIKYCTGDHGKTLVDVAPSRTSRLEPPMMSEVRRTPPINGSPFMEPGPSNYSRSATPNPQTPYTKQPHIHIAAIDNSLSFPHEHPKGWRSYTYGWLYLPVTIIGRPFSQKSRDHFLPLLTSKVWWAETTYQLRKLFAVDPDFHPKMFNRQLAVIKGQAWNIVQSLKHGDEGPLELTRRQKVLVWDDEVAVADELLPDIISTRPSPVQPPPASPHASINTMPIPVEPRRTRSQSASDFPPPMRRVSTEYSRPVSFSKKFSRVHPATTGVTVLEHMERLDAVEAGLKRLGVEETVVDDDEEVDVGESSRPKKNLVKPEEPSSQDEPTAATSLLSPSAMSERLPSVPENGDEDTRSFAEEDLVAMSKSMSHMERPPNHGRLTSDQGRAERSNLEWMHVDTTESPRKRTVIVERLETVDTKPFFSCW